MYKIIKVQNNNDLRKIYLDITRMKDTRIRISILTSKYQYTTYPNLELKPILDGDYSCSVVRRNIETIQEAREIKEELYKYYDEKFKDEKPKETTSTLTFRN
tara:strand:- start:193 stop:498 length:306 start_codon:yes stop_codon:yes gene_type:complete